MPTSSTSSRQSRPVGSTTTTATTEVEGETNGRIYWPNAIGTNENSAKSRSKFSIKRTNQSNQYQESYHQTNITDSSSRGATVTKKVRESKLLKKQQQPSSNSSKLATLAAKYNKISHISPPTSLTSTSVALRNSVMVGGGGESAGKSMKGLGKAGLSSSHRLTDQLQQPTVVAAAVEDGDLLNQPASLLNALSGSQQEFLSQQQGNNTSGGHFAFLGGKSFLINQNNSMSPKQAQKLQSQSQASLMSQTPPSGLSSLGHSNNSSTTHLQQMMAGSHATSVNHQQQQQLQIGRRMDLKYVKSFIIILMAADLLITVFVHQFATNDELSLSLAWLRSIKLRLSLINLVLSSFWFVILIGGILFDVYYILFASVLIDLASFLLLLGLSVIHFTRRIDYNTVQLTSLLALLFSVVVLHVYTLVMAALTLYLMLAVRRRQRCSRQPQQ